MSHPAGAVPAVGGRDPSGRGKATLALTWHPRSLPEGTTITPVSLIAHDGDVSRAMLYERGGAETVVALMHPRQDVHRSSQIIDLLEAGFAVWAHNNRDVNNDLRLVHERILLDLGAGMEWLRERDFDRVVLLGISGGAALCAYYTQQALLEPSDRIDREPSGKPADLPDAELPAPDGLALLAPHPGQGRLLMKMIDPSVIDELDPMSVDSDLDPFDAANGFGMPPEGSKYSPDFVAAYRNAQLERVRRIDARANHLIRRQRDGRSRWKETEAIDALRQSLATPVLTTYRTDADLRCTDLSIEPTDRTYGSIISARPYVSNYGVIGFGRLTTPEAWLSTWSGLSSNAALERAARGVSIPTFVVQYTGDQAVFPQDVDSLMEALATADKAVVQVRGTHFGAALSDDEEPGGIVAMRHITEWIADGER